MGNGHLGGGGVFARGNKVAESLWLINRLKQEAKQSGSRVHLTN